ncbi:MAG: hypothetical protein ABII25_09115 [bacterium]
MENKCQKEYGRGIQDAKNASPLEILMEELTDVATVLVPKTEEYKSYKAGYDDQVKGEAK